MTELVEIVCYAKECRIAFGLARDHYDQLKRNGQAFYCTCGHQQHFILGKTKEQKLREELDDTLRRAQRAEQRVAQEQNRASHHKARAAAFKGQVTKIKRRVGAGICPCCNRHFANLSRHMAGQHPDFATPEHEEEAAHG